MSGLLIPTPRLQFFKNDGTVNAGGSLSSFVTGTNTPALTYSDAALTVSNGPVITLDSAGRPMVSGSEVGIYIGSAIAYRFILKDSAGSQIWLADPVSVPAQAGAVIPTPSAPNQVIRSTDGLTWTASDSPTLAALTTVGAVSVGTTLDVTGATTLSSTLNVTGVATLTVPLGIGSGGTGAALTGTGGTKHLVKQVSTGAVFTVGAIDTSWLSDYVEWTAVSFTAGDFTSNGSMTWTVASGDLLVFRYKIIGKTMQINIRISGSTIGGTPDTTLMIKIPASKTAAIETFGNLFNVSDNGVNANAIVTAASGQTLLSVSRQDGANWTASTDNTSVAFTFQFQIQ